MKERRADKQSATRPRAVRLLNCLVYGSTISKKILFALLVLTPCLATPSGGVDAGYSPQMLMATWNDINRTPAHYAGAHEDDDFSADRDFVFTRRTPWQLVAAWYSPIMGLKGFGGPSIDYLFSINQTISNKKIHMAMVFDYEVENYQTANHSRGCGKDLADLFSKRPGMTSIAYKNLVYTLCNGIVFRFDYVLKQKENVFSLVPTDLDMKNAAAVRHYLSLHPADAAEVFIVDSGDQLPSKLQGKYVQ